MEWLLGRKVILSDTHISIASLEFLWLPIIQGLGSKIKIENITSYWILKMYKSVLEYKLSFLLVLLGKPLSETAYPG